MQITDKENNLVLQLNNNFNTYSDELLIHKLFETQVEKTPNNIALISGEKQLTYRELNQRSNQLAHYLRDLGVKPEVFAANFTRGESRFIGFI